MVKPFQSTRDSFQHTFVQFWRHRKIPLKGTYNFRDMGGYPTKEGQQIRWKTLYRSDHLHNLNTKALNTLSALELDTMVDFRTLAERKRLPDRLPHGHKIRLVNLPLGNPRNPNANVEIEDQI